MPILDRLVGLETEYTLRFRPAEAAATAPTRFQLVRALLTCLKRQVLTAPARHVKQGLFLANGGAVWFETERPATGGGLLRGATPECRGPLEVLRYQRAMDQLVGQSARLAPVQGQFSLIKNERGVRGNVGAIESYEATLGGTWLLWFWRIGLLLLAPLVLLTWLGVGFLIVGVLIYLTVAGLVYLPWRWFSSRPRTMALLLFGRGMADGRETGSPTPVWLESTLLWLTRLIHAPLAVCLWGLVQLVAFRTVRRQLVPFLVSRGLVCGAGRVSEDGRYAVADKASSINCLLGLGGYVHDRPIFTFAHFFKAICVESWLSPRDYGQLLRPRQQLQIGLGDANVAEMAEFLRVGTTALVLDVIEAGELSPVPALLYPVRALHEICADETLVRTVPLAGGGHMTGLELQRWYLRGCQQFLARRPDAPEEAHEVAAAWEEVLVGLEQLQATGDAPQTLVGSVDWITKRHLLDEAGSGTSPEMRRTIDLLYHELSPLGYYQMLQAAGLAVALVGPQELERASRTPPADTPATMRGHYIREFSCDPDDLSVNWQRVVIGHGLASKSIPLARYARRAKVVSEPPRLGTHDSGRPNAP